MISSAYDLECCWAHDNRPENLLIDKNEYLLRDRLGGKVGLNVHN